MRFAPTRTVGGTQARPDRCTEAAAAHLVHDAVALITPGVVGECRNVCVS